MNPCDLTHLVPEWQAIGGLITCSIVAFATGIALGITIKVSVDEEKERRLSQGVDRDTVKASHEK